MTMYWNENLTFKNYTYL